jgi:hypothetical protein
MGRDSNYTLVSFPGMVLARKTKNRPLCGWDSMLKQRATPFFQSVKMMIVQAIKKQKKGVAYGREFSTY